MKTFLNKISSIIQRYTSVQVILVFMLFFAIGGLMYFSLPRLLTMDDPMFHIRFAQLLLERGPSLFSEFPWLYHSDIAQDQKYFIYYNFLFYLTLSVFTLVKPLYVGLQLYGVVFFAGIMAALYYFLTQLKISYRLLWVLLFASIFATDFGRLFIARPFVIAPMLLILQMLFLYKQRTIAAVVVSVMYVFWHPATFFLPLVSLLIYFLFLHVFRLKEQGRIFLVTTIAILLSIGTLLFFTPGFFVYMKDIILGIYVDTIIGEKVTIQEGAEVYPVDFIDFILSYKVVFFAFILSAMFEITYYLKNRRTAFKDLTKKDALRGALFFLSILFFLGTFFSRRALDFFIFFSFAQFVLVTTILLTYVHITERYIRTIILWSIILVLSALLLGRVFSVQDRLGNVSSPDQMYPVMRWIDHNVPDGDVIFHPTWDWFPQMFYHNPTNNYITGIEPRFLYKHDPRLYWAWYNISSYGYLCEEESCKSLAAEFAHAQKDEPLFEEWAQSNGDMIADYIIDEFESHYIIVSDKYGNFRKALENSERYDEVYNTPAQPYSVYKISDN